MGRFGKSRLRKGISIVAAMVLLLNTVLPTVPVFATETVVNDWDYIYNESSWNDSYENGILKEYYEVYDGLNAPYKEDLWNTVENRAARLSDARMGDEGYGTDADGRTLDENGNYIYDNCVRNWLGAKNAPGAIYPWVAVELPKPFTGTIKLVYDGSDTYYYPGEHEIKTFPRGFYIESVVTMFGDEYQIDGSEESTFDSNKLEVTLIEYVAQIDGVGYETFDEAVAASDGGNKVITLLTGAGTYTMSVGQTLKVEKNGKNITVKAPDYYVVSSSTAEGVTTYAVVEAEVEYTNLSNVVSYKLATDLGALNGGTYKLLTDVTRTFRMAYGSWDYDVTIDLNGHVLTSTAPDAVILLGRAGSAANHRLFSIVDTSAGKGGKIVATGLNPSESTDALISVSGKFNDVTIGEGVILEGGAVFLGGESQTLNAYGAIDGGDDFAIATNGSGTVNPVININEGAEISSSQTAIYLPGKTNLTTTIDGTVVGGKTAVEIRAGALTIGEGAELTSNGEFEAPAANGNGTTMNGVALAISQHTTNLPISVTINGGTFSGAKAIYEEDLQDEVATDDISISISSGNFNGDVYSENVSGFINGGIFSPVAPSAAYIEDGYYAKEIDDDKYAITEIQEITSIDITSDTTGVYEGELPAFTAATTTSGLTVSAYLDNTIWTYWPDGYSSWHGFGSDTPIATGDGSTHYALRLQLDKDEGYVFADDVTINFNGTDWTTSGRTLLDLGFSWGGYLYIDLGTAMLPVYTVTFDSDGGDAIDSQEVTKGEFATEPDPTPTKVGFSFSGWYLNDDEFDFTAPIMGDITLTGKRIELVTITSIDITGITTPVAGTTRTLDGIEITTTPEDAITIESEEWTVYPADNSSAYTMATGETFNTEDSYSFSIVYRLKTGYKLSNTTTYPENSQHDIQAGENPGYYIIIPYDDVTSGYTVTWKNGEDVLETDENVANGSHPSYDGTRPTKAATSSYTYTFSGWSKDGTSVVNLATETITEDTTYSAIFTQKKKSGGGGGGSNGGSTTNTGNNASTGNTVTTTGDSTNVNTGDNTSVNTGDTANVNTGDTTNITEENKNSEENKDADSNENLPEVANYDPNLPADKQILTDGLTPELHKAYNFSHENGITTTNSATEADMYGPLTRIAMAKMLSQYAINILGQKPDTTKTISFPDVSPELDAQYNNGVTLAYQLGIMGIGIDKFRPNDIVTRAEFVTALSRMLYGLADGQGVYYETHMQKLLDKKIITVADPNMKELRGYVMIMLMRSAENK